MGGGAGGGGGGGAVAVGGGAVVAMAMAAVVAVAVAVAVVAVVAVAMVAVVRHQGGRPMHGEHPLHVAEATISPKGLPPLLPTYFALPPPPDGRGVKVFGRV